MLEHAGILFLHLLAVRNTEEETIVVRGTHSLNCPMKNMQAKIHSSRQETAEINPDDVMEIYCVIGERDQAYEAADCIVEVQRKIYDRILKNNDPDQIAYVQQQKGLSENHKAYPVLFAWQIAEHTFCGEQLYMLQQFELGRTNSDITVRCFGVGSDYEDSRLPWMEQAVRIWLEQEEPKLLGRQVTVNSFLLDDLRGRRIIGALPDDERGGFYLLVEGGRKVHLGDGDAYFGEHIGLNDIGMFSVNDVDTITNNPIYAYGIMFNPYELFEEWQKIFLYALAVLKERWTAEELQAVYEMFLEFMKVNICDYEEGLPAMISLELYYGTMCVMLDQLKSYLKGNEEVVLSKDWLLLLRNRNIYLDKLYYLLEQHCPEDVKVLTDTKSFEPSELAEILGALENGTVHEKGIAGERAAEYLFSRIPGLKISGKRIRTDRQEIVLCCVNTSVDEELWELGALILIECKNWKKNADVSVIRNMAQVMHIKGISTGVLFSRTGLTSHAEKEILEHARSGEYILCITKKDLENLKVQSDCYRLLMNKYNHLEQILADDIGLLG